MRLTYTEGGSSKFWEGEVDGAHLTVRWGKIGTNGQAKITYFSDAARAEAELARLVNEKLKKGYVAEGTPPAVSSTAQQDRNHPIDLPDLVARLDRWFSTHRPDYYHKLRPGAAAETLASVEKKVGHALPPALRALLTWRDGEKEGRVGRFYENWSLMDSKTIVDTARGMIRLEKAGEFDFNGWWRASWIPFLENGGGANLCVDADSGEVLEFWHDGPNRSAVAPSLDMWLEIFVTTLEADAWDLDRDHGYFEADDRILAAARKRLAPGYPKKRVAQEKGEMPGAPVTPPQGTGTIDRETAQRLLSAWGNWIGRKLVLPKRAPFVIRKPKRWVEGGCPDFYEHDPSRGALIVRVHATTYPLQAIEDAERFAARLRNEKSASLAKAKAWLELGEPVLDFNPEHATILARRDFLDGSITDEKFVEACRLLSKAAYTWSERNWLSF